jgi:sulfite reductase (NADPH) hemoprotein beta-component
MYRYDKFDQQIVDERVAQYRDQTRRFLAGELTEDEFRPLRLQNGLYIQRHAPMLRVAIPYGLLNSTQLRKLARIARVYDKGYGHFTTRQNIQYNWPRLEETPDILAELAEVEMHAIQTSGNCVRNITSDHFAGVAPDELVHPLALAEILRQWSTFHPEFAYLPRKFKIAINGATEDRAATFLHDIGLWAVRNAEGELGLKVIVGGGMGRTPIIGHVIREFLPWQHMLTYIEAILRVYNRHGRRDNIYKARIKILVKALGMPEFTRQVEAEWSLGQDPAAVITQAEYERVVAFFGAPAYERLPAVDSSYVEALADSRAFSKWTSRNVHPHKVDGYAAVTLSLKKTGVPPGDATADQLDFVAELADRYSFGELRVSHEQNLILADVKKRDLFELWLAAKSQGLATPNVGLLTNMIVCPGGDFCSLANAKSLPIAAAIQARFDDLDYLHDIGELDLNISGCMNSCGHHHVGHIGILGVDKKGEEFYQVLFGGRADERATIATIQGPGLKHEEVAPAIRRVIDAYLGLRRDQTEKFIDTMGRIGQAPFKEALYAVA